MAFVDELTIYVRAGRGGDGVVRWLHLKGKEFSGPAGGNGGDGGSVYLCAVRDIGLLARYRGAKSFEAGDGGPGESASRDGARGEDIIIDLPCGSMVRNRSTGEVFDLVLEGQKIMILRGGRGGAGNAAFKSSVNRTPRQSTPGSPGEEAGLEIELRLIADCGIIGLPNAGKTSLLNALTRAGGKVGAYPFTTLDPNLGAFFGHTLADIPGLIEGAAEGKGLGFKFLRHIARTKLLLHCVPLDSADPVKDYTAVRAELGQFEDGSLEQKPEIIVLTKSDTREKKEIRQIADKFRAIEKKVYVVSVLDDDSIKKLQDSLISLLR